MADKTIFKPISMQGLVDMPPESAESGYRRGYHDGWVRAIDTMHDLMFLHRLNRQNAYNECWNFWERELMEWVKAIRENSEFEVPPDLRNTS